MRTFPEVVLMSISLFVIFSSPAFATDFSQNICKEDQYMKPYIVLRAKKHGPVVASKVTPGVIDLRGHENSFVCINGAVIIYNDVIVKKATGKEGGSSSMHHIAEIGTGESVRFTNGTFRIFNHTCLPVNWSPKQKPKSDSSETMESDPPPQQNLPVVGMRATGLFLIAPEDTSDSPSNSTTPTQLPPAEKDPASDDTSKDKTDPVNNDTNKDKTNSVPDDSKDKIKEEVDPLAQKSSGTNDASKTEPEANPPPREDSPNSADDTKGNEAKREISEPPIEGVSAIPPPIKVMFNKKYFDYKIGASENIILDVSFAAVGKGPHCLSLKNDSTIVLKTTARDEFDICRWSLQKHEKADTIYKQFFRRGLLREDYKWVECPQDLSSNDTDDTDKDITKPFATYKHGNVEIAGKDLKHGGSNNTKVPTDSGSEEGPFPDDKNIPKIYLIEVDDCEPLPKYDASHPECAFLNGSGNCDQFEKLNAALELDSPGTEDPAGSSSPTFTLKGDDNLHWKHEVLSLVASIFSKICLPIRKQSAFHLMRLIGSYIAKAHAMESGSSDFSKYVQKSNTWEIIIAHLKRCNQHDKTKAMEWEWSGEINIEPVSPPEPQPQPDSSKSNSTTPTQLPPAEKDPASDDTKDKTSPVNDDTNKDKTNSVPDNTNKDKTNSVPDNTNKDKTKEEIEPLSQKSSGTNDNDASKTAPEANPPPLEDNPNSESEDDTKGKDAKREISELPIEGVILTEELVESESEDDDDDQRDKPIIQRSPAEYQEEDMANLTNEVIVGSIPRWRRTDEVEKLPLPFIQEYIPPAPQSDPEQMTHEDFMYFPDPSNIRVKGHSEKEIFYYRDYAELAFELNPVIDAFWKVMSTVMGYCRRHEGPRGHGLFSLTYNNFNGYFLDLLEEEWKRPSIMKEVEMVSGEFMDEDRNGWLDTCMETAYIISNSIQLRPIRPLEFDVVDSTAEGGGKTKLRANSYVSTPDDEEGASSKYFVRKILSAQQSSGGGGDGAKGETGKGGRTKKIKT